MYEMCHKKYPTKNLKKNVFSKSTENIKINETFKSYVCLVCQNNMSCRIRGVSQENVILDQRYVRGMSEEYSRMRTMR